MRNYKAYPSNWRELARSCKDRAGWRCECCRVKHGSKRVSKRTGRRYTVYLQAAHKYHDTWNPDPELLCLCFTCHAKYDYPLRVHFRRADHERRLHRILLVRSGQVV